MADQANEAPTDDLNAPQPILFSGSPFDFVPPNPLAAYRTIIAARGLADINNRLAEGWELIMGEFCEEVLQRSTTSRMPTSTAYQPYALLGKREPLIESDRQALAAADERAASDAAIPLSAEPPTAEDDEGGDPTPVAATVSAPMGAKKEPHRTMTVEKDGYEPIGGARDRK